MKKRLVSIALVIVMLVAMIPAFATTTMAADVASYRTVATGENIVVDGNFDDAYKYSEKIVATKWGSGNSWDIDFEVYTAISLRGLHVWAFIKDVNLNKSTSTAANVEDKFQVYMKTADGYGWIHVDYNGKIQNQLPGTPAVEVATQKLTDGKGWKAELLIPFTAGMNAGTLANLSDLEISLGFQANSGTSAACYDVADGASHWTSPDYCTKLSIHTFGSAYNYTNREKTAVYVETSPTVDGTKDAVYSEHAKVKLDSVINEQAFTDAGDTRSDLGVVYFAFDDEAIYVYYETEDKDLTTEDYCQLYYYFDNANNPISGYFCTKLDSKLDSAENDQKFYGDTQANYGYPGFGYGKAQVTIARKDLGNNMHSVEIKLPIPTQDKKTLEETGRLNVKLAFSANDYSNADDKYVEDDNTALDRRAYGGCTPASTGIYNYSYFGYRFPELVLSKTFTDANPGVIKGASVSLGKDISVNYYAAICPTDIDSSYMKFTRNGKTTIVYPQASSNDKNVSREATFTYEGIAPQAIGDTIKAELYVGGKLVSVRDNYSVLKNVLNIYNNDAYSSDTYNSMKWLIRALLNYGAAAQEYTGYNVNNLVNAGYEIDLLTPTASSNVSSMGSQVSNARYIDSVGVRFGSENQIYVKFKSTTDLDKTSVTINNMPTEIFAVEGETLTYIAYSTGISVLDFARTVKVSLHYSSNTQTGYYSVDSYSYSMSGNADANMAKLAKATYTYGEYARRYANIDSTSYKVMTVNDADNSYASNQNYVNVAALINSYMPDIVGMQEVQQAHVNGSNSYYAQLLPAYGRVYFTIGSSAGLNEAGERNNPSGNPILYRTDKFTLVNSGIKWLSNTPDTASRVTGSDYTRAMTWARLRDKKTGEEIVVVNTHLDYIQSYEVSTGVFTNPNLEQSKILLNLVETMFPNDKVLMTADWNANSSNAGCKEIVARGYDATENLIADPYRPETTIDKCFVDPDEFKVLDYIFIGDHRDIDHAHYQALSDHPVVISEIVPVKATTQKDLPEDTAGDVVDGPFISEDDIQP